jgi:hypothetical protein
LLLSVVVAVLKVHFKANHIDIKFTTFISDCIQVWLFTLRYTITAKRAG